MDDPRTLAQEKLFLCNPNLASSFFVTMTQSIHVTFKNTLAYVHLAMSKMLSTNNLIEGIIIWRFKLYE